VTFAGHFAAAVLAAGLVWTTAASLRPPGAAAADLNTLLPTCLACHGESGVSTTDNVPSLGAQPADYLLVQLFIFRNGQRTGEPMNTLTKDFTDDDLQVFATALGKLPAPPPAAAAPDAERVARAAALIDKYHCGFCHNPDLTGHDQIPRLARQREDYLIASLRGFKAGTRAGYDPAMAEVMEPITDAEILDLAYAISRL